MANDLEAKVTAIIVEKLGVDESEVQKLDMASDEQLRDLETILQNEETATQVKQDRVEAILADVQ